jgi:serine/threonine protein kinase
MLYRARVPCSLYLSCSLPGPVICSCTAPSKLSNSTDAITAGFVEKRLVTNLLKECAKMYEFDHPNVLKLTGVCLDGGPAPYLVMPFMVNGSLLSYLKKGRKGLVLEPSTSLEAADVVRTLIFLVVFCLGTQCQVRMWYIV